MTGKGIFFPSKDKALANKISITSPKAFQKSIRNLSKGGINTKEKRALELAQTRAGLQLMRGNLSSKERSEFKTISKMKIPKVTRR